MEPAWVRECFPAQRAFVLDGRKTVAAVCSRRAGKSHGKARRLLRAAERVPGGMSLYIAQTKNNARMIVGRAIEELNRRHALGLTLKEVDQRLMAVHPNGHHIWLAGARHREAFEDFRGYAFAEVQVDEAQFHGAYLQEVCEEIIEPALGDHDGALVLSGTPSPLPVGYFHAITTGLDRDQDDKPIPKWPTHHWTVSENVFFRGGQGAEWREEIRRRRGWELTHPRYVREYLGEWVHDSDSLVYPYDHARNAWAGQSGEQLALPEGSFVHVIGVDLGSSASAPTTAFSVVAHRRGFPEIFVIESYKRAGMTPARIAAELELLRQRYPGARIVIDEGGLGGGYAAEFRERYGIGVEAAEKRSKFAFIEMLRGDILAGTLKVLVRGCGQLLDEWALVQWTERRDDIDPRFEDHCADATLYAWRACRAWYRPEEEPPSPGSPEALSREMKALKRAAERKVREQQRKKRR